MNPLKQFTMYKFMMWCIIVPLNRFGLHASPIEGGGHYTTIGVLREINTQYIT